MDTLLQLYPHAKPVERIGAYLAHDLRGLATNQTLPYVYANFITSLDGRIAITGADGVLTVPKNVVNERDWRLFQELAAQADLIISSGRYLRDWAAGRAQEILQIDDPRFTDLRAWRLAHGLAAQPDIAIISNSLDFPIPDVLTAGGRKVVVFTSAESSPQRRAAITAKAGNVIIAGQQQIDGKILIKKMGELGYQTIYASAGPKIHHMLLAAGVLNRLYLTQANRILGGQALPTIVEGGTLSPTPDLKIASILFDQAALDGLGQLLLAYDVQIF